MADEKEKPAGSESAVTTTAVKTDEKANEKTRLSQTAYKGNSHFDLVEIEITNDGDFYKKGQKDSVHPTLAAILKEKGLIDSYKGEPTK